LISSIVLKILVIVIPLLISVAYFTIAERKIMGSIQRRRGPNVIGFLGLLQPLADGLKLFAKETILPSNSSIIIFLIAHYTNFHSKFDRLVCYSFLSKPCLGGFKCRYFVFICNFLVKCLRDRNGRLGK